MSVGSKRATLVLMAAGVLLLFEFSGMASASLAGPCEATGTIAGTTYNAKSLPDVIKVARKGLVGYSGTHTAAVPDQERSYRGDIDVDLFVRGAIGIAQWGPGKTKKTAKSGIHAYELDERLPSGVKIPISGEHRDSAGNCSGSAVIQIEGEGSLDAALEWAAIAGLGIFGGLWLASGREKTL